ncbi:MAG TPA: choice-of-anchor Q domain-containing protein, partial [Thermomicrobiales bacterium]|nr:choice-of-anchor Q domain-containing protein [Thermomicrobiales bacterium]
MKRRSRVSQIMRRVIATVAIATGTAIVVGVLGVSSAGAATFTVTNTADSGPGSLRRAIADAGGTAGSDAVQFAPGVAGKITLTSGQITITSPVDVQGPGADLVTVSGNDQSRVFTVQSGKTASISGLTVADGSAGTGGGIRNDGTLTLTNVTVRNNGAGGSSPDGRGGGIFNTGSLTLQRSFVDDNAVSGDDAAGGGIENDGGSVALLQSTVRDNEAVGTGEPGDGTGGGIANDNGNLTIRSSTLSGNQASGNLLVGVGQGGAVFNGGRNLVITNSTISGNSTLGDGAGAAGIEDSSSGVTTLSADTIASNTAGALDDGRGVNLTLSGAQTTITNTIVADARGGPNCVRGTALTTRYDLEDANTCGFNAASDQRNKEPRLAPLEDNGGPTRTRSIPISSPATDQGISAGLDNDQRGKDRPSVFPDIPKPPGGDGSDIGAYEIQAILATVTNNNDSGSGSLRQALGLGAIQVRFAPSVTGTIALTSGPLRINTDTEIVGPAAGSLTVSGSDQSRVFEVATGTTTTIRGLTVSKG